MGSEAFDSVLASHKYTRKKFWATYYAFYVFQIIFLIVFSPLITFLLGGCLDSNLDEEYTIGKYVCVLCFVIVSVVVSLPSVIRPEFAKTLRSMDKKKTELKEKEAQSLKLFENLQVAFLTYAGTVMLLTIILIVRISLRLPRGPPPSWEDYSIFQTPSG